MRREEKPIEIIILVLNKVIGEISPNTDFVPSNFENLNDALLKINSIIDKLAAGNNSALKDVSLLFAPTGCLHELSIANGWGPKYMDYADIIDKQIEKAK